MVQWFTFIFVVHFTQEEIKQMILYLRNWTKYLKRLVSIIVFKESYCYH